MNDQTWYLVVSRQGLPHERHELRRATNPDDAVAATGYRGEVAVYVADYIGRWLVEDRPTVTRLSTGRVSDTGLRLPP